MLRKTGYRAERLSTLVALGLLPAVGVHPLVPAQVGELGVALFADLADKGFDAAVDVGVLLQAGTGAESLAALGAGVTPGPHVVLPDVVGQAGGVGEHLGAVLAGKPPELAVHLHVLDQVRLPGELFAAARAGVVRLVVTVLLHHVFVQPEIGIS